MRQLNKIVFINSATIRYREVFLDGNVHFIGTQGVGKSTVLRAILFFYNGDTQKLGIPREKKIFAEYYFSHTNSYILYEVERETGPFTVLAMRSGAGVIFRFIDAPYDPDWMLADNQAPEKWGDIRRRLDELGIDSSNRVDRLIDYRDIIYGNPAVKAANRKYALLESKQYQNIPRTITNVFLNTKLEAGFIKETIIHSLSEEEMMIDLMAYRHHLRDFEKEYADIQSFLLPKNLSQADEIIADFNKIKERTGAKAESAACLGGAVKEADKEIVRQQKQREVAVSNKDEKQQQNDKTEKRRANGIALLRGSIKSTEAKIRAAQKKERDYNEKGIEGILERLAKSAEWRAEEKRLTNERTLLTAKFDGIEQEFQVWFQQLENDLKELGIGRDRSLHEVDLEFQKAKERQDDLKADQVRELRESLEEKLDKLQRELSEENEHLTKRREDRVALREKEWHGEEIRKLEDGILEAKSKAKEAEAKMELHRERTLAMRGEWQREEEKLKTAKEGERVRLDGLLKLRQEELDDTRTKLDRYKSALYGYLQENYPDWRETIGRVAREDILFNEDLQPELKQVSDLFFGLGLKLQHVEVSAKTLEQYELEKKNLARNLAELHGRVADLEAGLINDLDKLTKKYRPKVREQKDEIQRLELDKQQRLARAEKARLDLEVLRAKAESEKAEALGKIDPEIQNMAGKVAAINQKMETEKISFRKEEEKLEKSFAKVITGIGKTQETKHKEVERAFSETEKEIRSRIADWENRRKAKLKDAGADTARLAIVDGDLQKVSLELRYIDDNRDLATEYRKDKRELFDRVPEFKNQRDKEARKLVDAEAGLEELAKKHRRELHDLDAGIRSIKEKIVRLEEGFDDLEQFAKSDLYTEIETWTKIADGAGDPYSISELIDEIRDISIALSALKDNIRDTTNRFLSRFSEANLFHFSTSLSGMEDYMAFAAGLKEFIVENKIAEYKRRVEGRFASILRTVSGETGDLISREGDIQKVVAQINRDFRERNFVGVIQSMEIRLEDSANRVVNTLKRIRQYEQEQGYTLGEQNLFNAANGEEQNKRAVEFLNQLNRDILESKRDRILLSDAFELRFRVVENENDSGWVEKLSNVGSEGTDVLVKAMINILLLNVFKNSASRKFKDFRLHCMMDEIGRLHPTNVRGILKFANDRNITLINGSPTEHDAMAYKHIYELRKDKQSQTQIRRLITVHSLEKN